jgi:hypothetical protein
MGFNVSKTSGIAFDHVETHCLSQDQPGSGIIKPPGAILDWHLIEVRR